MMGTFSRPDLLLRRQVGGYSSAPTGQNEDLGDGHRREHGETELMPGYCCCVPEVQCSTPSLTSLSVPISGWLCFPSPSSLPPGAPDLEGSGHPRRDAEVPRHRGVSAAGAGDIASALFNQLPAWVSEAGRAWGARTQDVAGSQCGGAIEYWRVMWGEELTMGSGPSAHLVRGSVGGQRDECGWGWHWLALLSHLRSLVWGTSTKEEHG